MTLRSLLPFCSLLLVGGSLAAGCGNKGDDRPGNVGGGLGGFGGQHTVLIVGACEGDESNEQECTVYIEQANGVTSCFNGFQYCNNGRWSDCLDPEHDPRVQ